MQAFAKMTTTAAFSDARYLSGDLDMDEASPIESNWDELVAAGKEFGKARNLQASAQKFQEAYDLSRSFSHTDDRRAESAYFLAYARYVQKQLRTRTIRWQERSAEKMFGHLLHAWCYLQGLRRTRSR